MRIEMAILRDKSMFWEVKMLKFHIFRHFGAFYHSLNSQINGKYCLKSHFNQNGNSKTLKCAIFSLKWPEKHFQDEEKHFISSLAVASSSPIKGFGVIFSNKLRPSMGEGVFGGLLLPPPRYFGSLFGGEKKLQCHSAWNQGEQIL